jgi:preprotein translocase subunit SecG
LRLGPASCAGPVDTKGLNLLTAIAAVVHGLVSLLLIVLVLLHSGRGGGLSDMFGGGVGASGAVGATVMERNLDRLTVATAIAFAITTVLLSWLLN